MELYQELWNAFNDIYFTESTHKYTDSFNTDYTSVTTFVGKFQKEKDWDEIAKKAGAKSGKDPQLLREEWAKSGKYATTLGTEVHAVMEYLWQNKNYEGDMDKMALHEGMIDDFNFRKGVCSKLYKSLKKMYIPIKNEFIVYDRDWKLCGTIDFLAKRKDKNAFDIIDWKTSKKFDKTNRWEKLLYPFDKYDACNCNEYAIQLSTYKAILEKHCPDIKIDRLILIQIPKEGTEPEIVFLNDFSNIITEYLNKKYEN